MLSALFITALTLLAPRQEQAAPAWRGSLLEAAPADAVLALVVEDVPGLWGRARASAWADVLRAPAFAPLWSQLDVTLQEDVLQGELTAVELLDAVQSVALVFERFEGAEPLVACFAVRLRPEQARVRELLQVTFEKQGELVVHRGRDVRVAGYEGEWMAVLDWTEGFALTLDPDRDDALDRVGILARRLEAGSEDGGLAARLEGLRADAPAAFELYLDVRMLADRAGADLDKEQRALWTAFGLEDLGWLGVQATLGQGVAGEVLTRFELPRSGLLSRWAQATRPPPVELARLAPADAIEVSVAGFDVHAAWVALRRTLSESLPDQAAGFEAGLEAARDTAGVDVESQLIELLTGDFAEFLLPIDLDEAEADPGRGGMALSPLAMWFSGLPGGSPGAVLLVGLRETGPVADLLEALVEVAGAGEFLQDEQVAGRWMTSLSAPGVPLAPSWAFLEDTLVLSLRAGPVRAVLAQASEDAPPSWLERQGHRVALAGSGAACVCSVADLERWLQAQVVSPMAWLAELVTTDLASSGPGSPQGPPELSAALVTITEALPQLVAQHLRGTMRSTMTIEAGVLSYRFWTQ